MVSFNSMVFGTALIVKILFDLMDPGPMTNRYYFLNKKLII